ncbi:MAG: GNAT family N-acetyltransferase [Lachnospiraceae bacterium]|nr:GNAT family N-acetyltransferase [Lachnospiraceae bacterium]
MSGTVELKTGRLLLRGHQSEDAAVLFEKFGSDPQMFEYSGWNPYQTFAMARETVESFIKSCDDPNFYGWGIVYKGNLIGTIGAYDYDADESRIEIGMSIERASWGQGFATEALTAVLHYLTEHENIQTVSAWCVSDNIGSRKALERAGMKRVGSEMGALEINGQTYDKLIFEYAMQQRLQEAPAW